MSRGNHLAAKIRELAARRNAVILAHNYQLPEVQDVADFGGDSLELSRKAAAVDAEVIVFCGVRFMAETASILSPGKMVLLPDLEAGCPMANMITAAQLTELKAAHPDATVVCYVNSSADVKAQSDYCCTSANAAEVVKAIEPDRPIIFVPDKYLASYTATKTGRDFILWEGYCPIHVAITPQQIERAKAARPEALVMVHPECIPSVTVMADAVLSTSGMCRFARETNAEAFIVGTEVGLLHRLRRENPGKAFFAALSAATCPNMKRITLEKVLWSLEDLTNEVRVPEDVGNRARLALDRMVAAGN